MKIAIVGTSPSCWRDAPFSDESWKVWSLSGCYEAIPRYDAWFELHQKHDIATDMAPEYVEFCKKAGNKLITFDKIDIFPEAQLYPMQQMIGQFGAYFTSTIAWMLALAISQKPTEIGLWGIDMVNQENEYHRQRACCEYFIGLARGMGIKVIVPAKCALLKGGLYPSNSMNDVNRRLKSAIAARDKARDDNNYYRGVADVLTDMQVEWA